MYGNLSQNDENHSPSKQSGIKPESYHDQNINIDKDEELLDSHEYENEIQKEKLHEIKELDEVIDGSIKKYQNLFLAGIFFVILNILLRLYHMHTFLGMILMTIEFAQNYIYIQGWKLTHKLEVKSQRYLNKYLRYIVGVSVLALAFTFISVIAHALSSNHLNGIDNQTDQEDHVEGEHHDVEKHAMNQKIELITLLICFVNSGLAALIYKQARNMEEILVKKHILKRDMDMPRLLSWD